MLEIPENVVNQALEVRGTGLCNMFSREDVQEVASDMDLYELIDWIEELPRRSKDYYKLLEAMSSKLDE